MIFNKKIIKQKREKNRDNKLRENEKYECENMLLHFLLKKENNSKIKRPE